MLQLIIKNFTPYVKGFSMKNNWVTLDHAAKLLISGIKKTETQTFRITCELTETIDPILLQLAAEYTLEHYPSYKFIMRKGFFWYYLESSNKIPQIEKEHKPVCSDMKCLYNKKLLFEISYFGKRIHMEVFHVLADGTSTKEFFQTLICKYLSLAHKLHEPAPNWDGSLSQRTDDSYNKYYSGTNSKLKKRAKAAQIRGNHYEANFLRNITARMLSNPVREIAKKHNATITIFLTACLIQSIGENIHARERKKPIMISVPVDLRNYFPSSSARNFWGSILIRYDWSRFDNSLDKIIQDIKPQFEDMLNKEFLENQLDQQSTIENKIWAKLAPLALKQIALRIVYKKSLTEITGTISNIGKIELDEEYKPYIRAFDICSSTSKIKACLCSYDDILSISFTNPRTRSDIEKSFFRILTEKGVNVSVFSNDIEERQI